ncbi:hypothetical protein BaRGS_00026468 [Batillaria attramentaria]|uniref:Uncharacterized protein n=1 Tax=Batillaria attramentaria TaxID=370345 RepID=A0ABD0K688_9CAEN
MAQRVTLFLVVAFCMTVLYLLGPAEGSIEIYGKAQQQASQMKAWKLKTISDIANLENLVNHMEDTVTTLNETLDGAFAQADLHADTLGSIVDDLTTILLDIQSGAASVPTYEAPVAFQAQVDASSNTASAWSFYPIVYEDTKLNHLDAYDNQTGIFTAPVRDTNYREMTITKIDALGNREDLAYLHYYTSQETSATTITHLEVGETVAVYPMYDDGDSWTLDSGWYNGFAGYLIAAD